jgi:hypothetical protein
MADAECVTPENKPDQSDLRANCVQSGGNLAMTYDPTQTYAMQAYANLGGYPGVAGQFGVPHPALQTLGLQPGISPLLGGGILPTQNIPYQNPLLQNPFVAGLQNPLQQQWQHPFLQQHPLLQQHLQQHQLLQHQLLQHAIQAQIQAQLAAQQLAQLAAQQVGMQPFGGQSQQISPFAQTGSPYGHLGGQFGQVGGPWGQGVSPLAPQTWIGQGGQFGGGYGQIHPLAHLGAHQYIPGMTPWSGI